MNFTDCSATAWMRASFFNGGLLDSMTLTRISHAPVRNVHSVPTSVGVNGESIRPGKLLPKQLATGDLLTNSKLCEKVRLTRIVDPSENRIETSAGFI
jgi:hypothetical protein